MSYSVKEIYLTIQGEGFHTGKHAVFCRISGCNLWTALEKDTKKAQTKKETVKKTSSKSSKSKTSPKKTKKVSKK